MNGKRFSIVAILIITALSFQNVHALETGTLKVVVKGGDGVPILKASVTVYDTNGAIIARHLSSADGSYTFKLPPGTYNVKVASYGIIERNGIDVAVDRITTTSVTFGTLVIKAITNEGAPIWANLDVYDGNGVLIYRRHMPWGTTTLHAIPDTYTAKINYHGTIEKTMVVSTGETTSTTAEFGRLEIHATTAEGTPLYAGFSVYDENGALLYRRTWWSPVTFPIIPGNHTVYANALSRPGVRVFPLEKTVVILGPPDLAISPSDILFSNENPPEGEIVNISATIHNTGDADVSGTSVSFFDGDPENGTLIDTVNTGPIAIGASETITTTWTVAPAGTHEIHVVVDPGDAIYEISEDNNHAWGEVNVTVSNVAPVAVASAYSAQDNMYTDPIEVYVGYPITFSSAGSYDPDGEIVSYLWDFLDGTTSNEENPAHVYEEPDAYLVKLEVKDDKGATSYSSILVEARCPPPSDVLPNIKNVYDRRSVLQMIRANLVEISPVQSHYIDVDINATLEGNFNFDICVDTVKGEFEFEGSRNKTFDRIGENVYFHNYEDTPIIHNAVGILVKRLIYKIFNEEAPPLLEIPDAYLRNMYVSYKPGPSLFGELHSFYYGDDIKIPTYKDAVDLIDGYVAYRVESPVDISVTDPLGREIGAFYENGYLNKEITEIPGVAIYTGNGTEPQYIIIADPEEGIYDLKVHGTGNGTYNLTVSWFKNDTVMYKEVQSNIPVKKGETFEYTSVVDTKPPQITILTPTNGSITNNAEVTWNASDNLGLGYFEILLDNVSYLNTTEKSAIIENSSEGPHVVEVKAYDLVNNSASSSVSFIVDITPPDISVRYPEKVTDYQQFKIEADVIDVNLQNVTFLQNNMPISYTVSDSTYASHCLGPYSAGTSLNYEIIAIDKADNTATEEFSIDITRGKLEIEGGGKLKESDRTIKIELETKWKKGEAKGELEFKEEVRVLKEDRESDDEDEDSEDEKKEKFKAHGKINILYKDCDGVFWVSGLAKTESGKGKDKVKEKDVPFTGSITGDEIKINIDGEGFVVPAKVKIKENGKKEERDED